MKHETQIFRKKYFDLQIVDFGTENLYSLPACICAGQRYGAAGDRVGDSTTAASSRLFLAGYDSGSVRANGIGRSQRGI
jgi:hypothetical protein